MNDRRRKGARSLREIPNQILEQLNSGEIETANLVEWLAVDQRVLLKNLLHTNGRMHYLIPVLLAVDQLKKATVNTINEAIGVGIFDQVVKNNDPDFLSKLSRHKADMVRCWAAYAIGKNSSLNIGEVLKSIMPFSADKHFGVREVSWLAVRHRIAGSLLESISILSDWTMHQDENVRRFTTEVTRPRGVWCTHIDELKQTPGLALDILEPLRSDPARYVQDSVGNWLNDASKTRPDFVIEICKRWDRESDTKATKYIIKKALRTVTK